MKVRTEEATITAHTHEHTHTHTCNGIQARMLLHKCVCVCIWWSNTLVIQYGGSYWAIQENWPDSCLLLWTLFGMNLFVWHESLQAGDLHVYLLQRTCQHPLPARFLGQTRPLLPPYLRLAAAGAGRVLLNRPLWMLAPAFRVTRTRPEFIVEIE
jgi:hypothetical protein